MKHGLPKKNADNSIVISNSSNTYIDVYPNSSLETIETLLESRLNGYKKIYSAPIIHIYENAVSAFLEVFMKTDFASKTELGQDLMNFKARDIYNININDFLKWDDIKFYSEIIYIAENHPDHNIRALAAMTIPTMKSFLNAIYSHLQIKNSTSKNFSNDELLFLKKVKHLIKSDTALSKALRNASYNNENTIFFDEISLEKLTDISSSNGIFPSLNLLRNVIHKDNIHKKAYSYENPIYVYDTTGKIFDLSKHPDCKIDWSKKSINLTSIYTYVPYLRFYGFSDEQIKLLKDISCDSKYSFSFNPKNKLNLQLLKVGNNIENCFSELSLQDER